MASPVSTFADDLFQGFDVDHASKDFLHDVALSPDTPALDRDVLLRASLVSGHEDWDARLQCAAAVRERELAARSPLDGRDVLAFVPPIDTELFQATPQTGWAETDRLIGLLGQSLRGPTRESQNKKPAGRDAQRASAKPKPKPAKSPYWACPGEGTRVGKPVDLISQGVSNELSRGPEEYAVKRDAPIHPPSTKKAKHNHQPPTGQQTDQNDVGLLLLTPPTSSTLPRTSASLQVPAGGELIRPLLPRHSTPFEDAETKVLSEPVAKSRSPVKSPFFAPESPKPSPKTKRPPAGTVSAIPFPPLTAPCFSLIQEELCHDPFWLLIAVTFLIKTAGKLAIPAFHMIKDRFPTPAHLADPEATSTIVEMIRHLGLATNRTSMIQKYARLWAEKPPQRGVVYRVRGYDRREALRELPLNANEPAGDVVADDAWEIGHMTQGKYALDSWRIFCRDELLGRAQGWNGQGAPPEFQPEWMRVRPHDKELRACLRWMYMKEGWEWDPETGDKTVLRPEMEQAVNEGRVEYDDTGGLRILDRPRDMAATSGLEKGRSGDGDEFTVLVTGFGPFKAAYPVNPSWEIARSLPSYLPPVVPSATDAEYSKASAPPLPPVRILVYPDAVRVNYQLVRALVPTLWDQLPSDRPSDGALDGPSDDPSTPPADASARPSKPPRIDLCIHIGMAGPRPFYCIEHRGHRDGYAMPDVDNTRLEDETRRREEGSDWVWADIPPELETDLDVRDVLKRWRRLSPDDADLRISEDAGRYLCDFIYMSSLAHLYKKGEQRRVVFLHVPCDASDEAVGRGTELATELIRAMVESELHRRREADVRKEDKIAVELRV
ncbi:hypothetical protein ACHAQA_004005 [Verticillium albo-atrum]